MLEPKGTSLLTGLPWQELTEYRVRYKDTLADTAWIDLLAGISLIGARGFCFDTAALPLKQRFYRVVADP